MVIISMLMAMGYFLVVLTGIVVFVIGIILGIISLVLKRRQKRVAPVILGILSVFFIVMGLITAIVPHFLLEGGAAIKDAAYNKEIAQFDDDKIAHVDHYLNLDEGFDYEGVHYDRCPDDILVPNGDKKEAGAIVYDDGKHTILYSPELDYGDAGVLCTENAMYCRHSDIDVLLDHYRNDTVLHGSITYPKTKTVVEFGSSDIDADKIRQIRDYVSADGSEDHEELDEEFDVARDVHIDLYSDDGVYWLSISFRVKHDAVEAIYEDRYAKLTDEFADYIRQITEDND